MEEEVRGLNGKKEQWRNLLRGYKRCKQEKQSRGRTEMEEMGKRMLRSGVVIMASLHNDL